MSCVTSRCAALICSLIAHDDDDVRQVCCCRCGIQCGLDLQSTPSHLVGAITLKERK